MSAGTNGARTASLVEEHIAKSKGAGGKKPPVPVVADNDSLRALCERLRGERSIAIDTEFMRDHCYWPKLCLVQLAGEKEAAVVDPLGGKSGGALDLAPLYDLLRRESIVKVFHAARQDIEIFFHDADLIPSPIFDTQIAAMVCGFGEAASYATLVNRFLGVALDKSSRLTDWSRRPLSAKQLSYAMDDVVHLRDVYGALSRALERSGRRPWVEEEMARLRARDTYRLEPRDAWRRLKRRVRSRRVFSVLIEVAAWRERLAQERNLPRGRILKDDGVHEIAAASPASRAELDGLRTVPKGFAGGKYAQSLLDAVAAGKMRAQDKSADLPKENGVNGPSATQLEAQKALVDLLKLLLKRQCERHGVASKLVADTSALEHFAVAAEGAAEERALLDGWRGRIFGDLALKAKRGHIGIGLEKGRLEVFSLGGLQRISDGVADGLGAEA